MRRLIPFILAAALAVPTQAAPRLEPEAQLSRALEGRVAGEPVRCVNLRTIRSSRVIDKTAILFDAGSTIYVNRPQSGQSSLDRSDTLVMRPHVSQLCSIDVVRTFDTASWMQTGVVFLGDFVPYKRAARTP